MTSPTANLYLTVVFAAGLPAFWFGGQLADRLPHVPYILAILSGFVGSVVVLISVDGVFSLLVVSIAIGYSIHSLFPALDTYFLSSLPDESRGATYAAFTGLSLLIEANGTAFVGTMVDAGYEFDAVFGGLASFVGCVVLGLAGLYATGRLPSAN
jgi:hypothetical protein